MLILWIVFSLVIAIAVWLAFLSLLNYLSGKGHWQEKFVAGTLPEPPPDGFYKRSVYLLGSRPVPWLGKSFEGASSRGFNIFAPTGASLARQSRHFTSCFAKTPMATPSRITSRHRRARVSRTCSRHVQTRLRLPRKSVSNRHHPGRDRRDRTAGISRQGSHGSVSGLLRVDRVFWIAERLTAKYAK